MSDGIHSFGSSCGRGCYHMESGRTGQNDRQAFDSGTVGQFFMHAFCAFCVTVWTVGTWMGGLLTAGLAPCASPFFLHTYACLYIPLKAYYNMPCCAHATRHVPATRDKQQQLPRHLFAFPTALTAPVVTSSFPYTLATPLMWHAGLDVVVVVVGFVYSSFAVSTFPLLLLLPV